ncbi:MAG: hypothetical protein V1743_02095 [Nanoarchaeota archaeon]
MKKRGSLSLSVNAIVVFILAFAMLGVGLFFINTIREKLTQGAVGVFDINQLKNPPTSDRPIVIPNEVTIKKMKKANLEIGYYNKGANEVTGAHPIIIECRDEFNNCLGKPATSLDGYSGCVAGGTAIQCPTATGTTNCLDDKLPIIASTTANVPGGEGKGFKVSLKENGLQVNQDYVCTLAIVDDTTGKPVIKETESFHLSVVS